MLIVTAAVASMLALAVAMVKAFRQVGFLWYAIRCLYVYHNR